LRLGFVDRPIGFPAEIVPKPFAQRLPFLLPPPRQHFLSSAALIIGGYNAADPFVTPPVIVRLEAWSGPPGDRDTTRAAGARSQHPWSE